ncbi:MAG: DUF2461 domain-containing protein [Desulfobacterales bacterium]|nr:DUF2461 domain-containing protein [Desulfobacterales bacterium]
MPCGTVYDRRLYWKSLWRRRSYPFALNIVPILKDNDDQGKIGRMVLDLGCSRDPVSNWLDLSRHGRVLLDVSCHVRDLFDLPDAPATVECDLCEFHENAPDYKAYREALEKAGVTLFDAVISADNLINYIPWRSVFRMIHRDIRNQGLVFVCFGVGVGRGEAFHPERPFSTREVLDFFTNDLSYRCLEACGGSKCYGLVLEKR